MNNNENDYTFFCSRCGAEMKSSSRYCMKCGNLNYDHPANANMKKFSVNNQETYSVGEGKTYVATRNNPSNNVVSYGNNTGNKNFCFWINIFLFFLINIASFVLSYLSVNDIKNVINTIFPLILASSSLSFLMLYSFEILFTKMNKRWWAALIPIYNYFVIADALFGKKIYGILFFIPGINFIFMIYMLYVLGKKFSVSPLFTLLLPIIMIPYISLSSKPFNGRSYVDFEDNSLEKEYKKRKTFTELMLFFAIIGIVLSVLGNIGFVKDNASKLNSKYYVSLGEKIVDKTKESIESNDFECDIDYDSNNGIYYFDYPYLADEISIPLQTFSYNDISAYVKVVNYNGVSTYSVSLTDTIYGFPETEISNLDGNRVVNYEKLEHEDGIKCYLK